MQTFTLTPVELAILTQRMLGNDVLPLDETALADLQADAVQIDQVEEELLERGLLALAPLEQETKVSSAIAPLLQTTLAPQLLCILRSSRLPQENQERQIYFSLSDEAIVCNYINAQGQHVFVELADAPAALHEMLSASGALALPPATATRIDQPLEALIKHAQSLAILLIVHTPAQPTAQPTTISWLVAHGTLWLLDPESRTAQPQARSVDATGLQQTILRAMGRFARL